jgi:hypothetical protein
MNTEWLTKYYRSLGWSEHRISDFLQRAVLNEARKKKEAEMK